MINHLEGNVAEKTPAHVVIDCGGVGYVLMISLSTFSKLPDSGKCKVYTEQLFVRDDLPRMYGFADKTERQLFRLLTSVSGVGGTSAILMLSSLSPQDIEEAINSGNVAMLRSVKGIGEKTAQRIIVDLKGKMGKANLSSDFFAGGNNKNRDEALTALVMLGFAKNVAEKALDRSMKTEGANSSAEQLIKAALKNL